MKPRYSICVAGYHHPNEPDLCVRATAVVVDLRTDQTVDQIAFDERALAENRAAARCKALQARWTKRAGDPRGVVTVFLDDTVPLERCTRCPCHGWLNRRVTSSDLAAIETDQRPTSPRRDDIDMI